MTLASEIMWVNVIHFMLTTSRHIRFITSHNLNDATSKSLKTVIFQEKQVYMQQGFHVTNLLIDGQFELLRDELASMKVALTVCPNYEQIGDIKRLNQTVKEISRAIFNMLPYPKLLNCMVVELVHFCIFCLKPPPPLVQCLVQHKPPHLNHW